jgi:hypothetical protein
MDTGPTFEQFVIWKTPEFQNSKVVSRNDNLVETIAANTTDWGPVMSRAMLVSLVSSEVTSVKFKKKYLFNIITTRLKSLSVIYPRVNSVIPDLTNQQQQQHYNSDICKVAWLLHCKVALLLHCEVAWLLRCNVA